MHSTYTQVRYTCTSCSVLLCSCCVVICTQIKGMCVCMPLHMVVAAMGMWGWCMCLYNNPAPLWCVALQCICWAYSMRAEDGEVSPWLWTLFGRDTTAGPVTSGGAEVIEGCQVGSDKLANIPIARARHHTHSMWLAVADGVCRSLQSLDLRDITPSKCLSGCQYGSHVHEQVTHVICGLCAHVLAICTCVPHPSVCAIGWRCMYVHAGISHMCLGMDRVHGHGGYSAGPCMSLMPVGVHPNECTHVRVGVQTVCQGHGLGQCTACMHSCKQDRDVSCILSSDMAWVDTHAHHVSMSA